MTKNIILASAILVITLFSCKKKEVAKPIFLPMPKQSQLKQFQPVNVPKHIDKPTEISFDKMSHDFGTINQGDKVKTEFTFTNTGKENLVIYEAKGSCGCTVPEYPKTPVKPGEKGTIKVQFNSAGKTGKQEKSVFISTNSKKGNETLKITADIKEKTK